MEYYLCQRNCYIRIIAVITLYFVCALNTYGQNVIIFNRKPYYIDYSNLVIDGYVYLLPIQANAQGKIIIKKDTVSPSILYSPYKKGIIDKKWRNLYDAKKEDVILNKHLGSVRLKYYGVYSDFTTSSIIYSNVSEFYSIMAVRNQIDSVFLDIHMPSIDARNNSLKSNGSLSDLIKSEYSRFDSLIHYNLNITNSIVDFSAVKNYFFDEITVNNSTFLGLHLEQLDIDSFNLTDNLYLTTVFLRDCLFMDQFQICEGSNYYPFLYEYEKNEINNFTNFKLQCIDTKFNSRFVCSLKHKPYFDFTGCNFYDVFSIQTFEGFLGINILNSSFYKIFFIGGTIWNKSNNQFQSNFYRCNYFDNIYIVSQFVAYIDSGLVKPLFTKSYFENDIRIFINIKNDILQMGLTIDDLLNVWIRPFGVKNCTDKMYCFDWAWKMINLQDVNAYLKEAEVSMKSNRFTNSQNISELNDRLEYTNKWYYTSYLYNNYFENWNFIRHAWYCLLWVTVRWGYHGEFNIFCSFVFFTLIFAFIYYRKYSTEIVDYMRSGKIMANKQNIVNNSGLISLIKCFAFSFYILIVPKLAFKYLNFPHKMTYVVIFNWLVGLFLLALFLIYIASKYSFVKDILGI